MVSGPDGLSCFTEELRGPYEMVQQYYFNFGSVTGNNSNSTGSGMAALGVSISGVWRGDMFSDAKGVLMRVVDLGPRKGNPPWEITGQWMAPSTTTE